MADSNYAVVVKLGVDCQSAVGQEHPDGNKVHVVFRGDLL